MKILVSAYACEPGKGSEPAVGWNRICEIADDHEVWVLTRANNRAAIEAHSAPPNVHFVYYDLPRWARFWKKGGRGIRAYYYLWQLGAASVARRLHREVGFDSAHHITLVSCRLPSLLAFVPVPFVWGPVGGGEAAPPAFRAMLSRRARAQEALRGLWRLRALADPLVWLTARRCSAALATTPETARELQRLGCRNVSVRSQVALSEEDRQALGDLPMRSDPPFRMVSLGRLLYWKGFDLAIRAFARLRQSVPESEYWIAGDGPERGRLARLCRELGVESQVRFLGALPREEALRTIGDTDVLVHPSLHDSGGFVCAEAMAARRPVVCLDLGGPGLVVGDGCGFRIAPISPGQAVEDMAVRLTTLAGDAALRRQMGEAARRRIKDRFGAAAVRKQAVAL